MMRKSLVEILLFARRHWPHILLIVPGAIFFTVLHEAAHAAAVLLQGGQIQECVVWPSSGEWGHVVYTFRPQQSYSQVLISLAPYCVWLAWAGVFCLGAVVTGAGFVVQKRLYREEVLSGVAYSLLALVGLGVACLATGII